MRSTVWAALLLVSSAPSLAAQQPEAPAVTIYSTARPGYVDPQLRGPLPAQAVPGYGIVQQALRLDLPQGRSEVRLAGVPAAIDPTTVRVHLPNRSGVAVLEQRFEFDLAGSDALLRRYLGADVQVEQVRGGGVSVSKGRLLALDDGLVLEQAGGAVQWIRQYDNLRLPPLEPGLVTQPTLVWAMESTRAGAQEALVSYETRGLTWWADYDASLHEGADGCRLELGSWATLVNRSGAALEEARIRLVAGEPQRASVDIPMAMAEARAYDARLKSDVAREALGDYHLYTLQRPASLPPSGTLQVRLFDPVTAVPCQRRYVFDALGGRWPRSSRPLLESQIGLEASGAVSTLLEFENSREAGLAVPLPAGRIRVSDGASGHFLGENTLEHTAAGETVRLRLGTAFDLSGERSQVDFRIDTERRTMEEEVAVEVRNATARPAKVIVEEQLYRWSNWEIVERSAEFERRDASTVRFPVTVPGEGTATVRYRVRYTW